MDGRVGSRAPLVGREQELGRVRQALDDAAAGRGSCWFVVGEPGSGKTRLAAELLQEARASGFAVLAGGASGVLATPAYGLVAQTLRPQLRGSLPLPRTPRLRPSGSARHLGSAMAVPAPTVIPTKSGVHLLEKTWTRPTRR